MQPLYHLPLTQFTGKRPNDDQVGSKSIVTQTITIISPQ